MLEITTAIFLTLIGSAFYHLIPAQRIRLRMLWVATMSFLIVFAHYPIAALFAFGAGFFAWVLSVLGLRIALVKKYGPFSLIGLLLVFSYDDILVATDPYSKTLVQFGMSFYVLRLYLALRTAAARKEAVGLEEFLTIALFFPIFPAGPICAQEAFTRSSVRSRPRIQNYLLGFVRIGIGIFALYFITTQIQMLATPLVQMSGYVTDWESMSSVATFLVMLLKFMDLYTNFVGYTGLPRVY